MAYKKFEDLEVWRRSAQLCANLYSELKDLRDFNYYNQITKSCLSISSNIAEGFERCSNKECIRFLSISKGSCGELRSQIIIGIRIKYINEKSGKTWIHEATAISSMLSGLIKARKGFINDPK